MRPIFLCLGICLLCMTPCCSQLDPYIFEENIDDCVPDITDMMDYDPVTQTSARCEKRRKERKQAASKCDGDLQARLEETEKLLDECRHQDNEESGCTSEAHCVPDTPSESAQFGESCSAEDMFFRRLTRHLVNVLQEKAPDDGPVEAEIQVQLTSHEWQKLQSFVNGKNHRKADIHDTLVGMTIGVFHMNETGVLEWISGQVNLKSPGMILCVVSFLVLAIVFAVGMYSDLYWNGRFLSSLMIAIFLISLLWNWIYLYQEETIKRYRNAQKYPDIPVSCMPDRMTWFQTMREWYRTTISVQSDPCLEYHRLYLVDPLFDIPPTRALTFTLSAMFVDPMKYLGRAVSEFHVEIFRDLPLWAALPALVTCYIFMFVAMYAYIAAPRRVWREAPRDNRLRRVRDGQGYIDYHARVQQEPVEHAQLPQIDHHYDEEIPRDDPAHHEGDRVENVKPPVLPAKQVDGQRAQKEQVKNEEQSGPGGHVQPKLQRQVVRRRRVRPPVDGNETDISAASSMEASHLQRPTHFQNPKVQGAAVSCTSKRSPKGLRQVGDAHTGACVHHPSSECSEYESLIRSTRSAGYEQKDREPEACVSPTDYPAIPTTSVETTFSTDLTPVASESPSDVSVISAEDAESLARASSDDETTSANYIISASTLDLGADSVSQSPVSHIDGDDDDDDFVVLSKSGRFMP